MFTVVGAPKKRVMRNPKFPIAGTMRPFGLYPLMVHPVLPGETLASAKMRWRVLTLPIKHPLAGAWLETWLCYVKLTDLDRALAQMFISDTMPTTGYTLAAPSDRYFSALGQIDWIGLCVRRIHKHFFLDEGEPAQSIDGVPKTKLIQKNWAQNLMFTPAGVNTAQLPSNPDAQLTGFQIMQSMGMSEMSYEKYLQTYGVQTVNAEIGIPEILRYSRSWTLPVNTVEPTTGAPSSAFVWSDDVTLDKNRRFDEPGFLVQLAALRPKMYQGRMRRSIVGEMWGFAEWFPSYNLQNPEGGIRSMMNDNPVFDAAYRGGVAAQSLLYDHRDILHHGEQFINNWTNNPYPLPMSTGMLAGTAATEAQVRGEYATDADIDALFTGATADRRQAYYEGLCELDINGHLVDSTT